MKVLGKDLSVPGLRIRRLIPGFIFRRAERLVAMAEKTGLSIRYERSGTIVIKNKGATY